MIRWLRAWWRSARGEPWRHEIEPGIFAVGIDHGLGPGPALWYELATGERFRTLEQARAHRR